MARTTSWAPPGPPTRRPAHQESTGASRYGSTGSAATASDAAGTPAGGPTSTAAISAQSVADGETAGSDGSSSATPVSEPGLQGAATAPASRLADLAGNNATRGDGAVGASRNSAPGAGPLGGQPPVTTTATAITSSAAPGHDGTTWSGHDGAFAQDQSDRTDSHDGTSTSRTAAGPARFACLFNSERAILERGSAPAGRASRPVGRARGGYSGRNNSYGSFGILGADASGPLR